MGKYLLVGKHRLTEVQRNLLERIGYDEMVAHIGKVIGADNVIDYAMDFDADIVVTGVPYHILLPIVVKASRLNKKVFAFFVADRHKVENREECNGKYDVIVRRGDGYMCGRTIAVEMITDVELKKKVVVTTGGLSWA